MKHHIKSAQVNKDLLSAIISKSLEYIKSDLNPRDGIDFIRNILIECKETIEILILEFDE